MSELYDEGLSRADVLDWRPWRYVTTEDRSTGATGAYLSTYGPQDFPQAGVDRFSNVTGAYTFADTTLTLAGAFTNYHWSSGDMLNVTSPAAVAGSYAITAKTSADAIVSSIDPAADHLVVAWSIRQAKRYIEPGPFGAVWLRVFGGRAAWADADGYTARIRISGWMSPDGRTGCGKGFILWDGTLTCGTGTGLPMKRSQFDMLAGAVWYEVDTYTATAGYDVCGAVKYGVANGQNMLLVPTLGYPVLLLEAIDLFVTAGEMDYFGAIWRPDVVSYLA